jgi:hypothetical protein
MSWKHWEGTRSSSDGHWTDSRRDETVPGLLGPGLVIGTELDGYAWYRPVPSHGGLVGTVLDFLGMWVAGGLGLGGLGLGSLGLRGLCGLDLSVGLGPSPPSVHIALCLLFFTSINIFCFQQTGDKVHSTSYNPLLHTIEPLNKPPYTATASVSAPKHNRFHVTNAGSLSYAVSL